MNKGDHWEEVAALPGAIAVFSLLLTRDGSILAGTFPSGDLFRSTDHGESWVGVDELEDARRSAVSCRELTERCSLELRRTAMM